MNVRENQPGRAAFEVRKGIRQVMTLSEGDVEKYLVFDPITGAASCGMDGTYITGVRTAASAIPSAREPGRIARRDGRRRGCPGT
jgi:hypothetical protein